MQNLKSVLSRIRPVNEKAADDCRARFDLVAKPLGSLGKLEELLARIAAITGSPEISLERKAVVVFCSDNGVVKRGVAQHSHEVTTAVGRLLHENRASVSTMAKSCHADVFAIDIGMIDSVEGLRDCKLMHGTNDITEGPAMSRKTAEKAIGIGIDLVKELKEQGYRFIATGEVGIGNTTTSSAVCSVLLNRPVHEVTGHGAGLDEAGLICKISAIEQAIRCNRPSPSNPVEVLHTLGGLDIAALTGVFLGGALHKVPVIMDGFISGVAALLAVRLCPAVHGYILPSHESSEPGARILMEELAFSPILQAEMRLGEGTGCPLAMQIIDNALAIMNSMNTFDGASLESEYREKIKA